jgi:hypothetical protein
MDLVQVLKKARKTMSYITTNSIVYFTSLSSFDINNRSSNLFERQQTSFNNIERRKKNEENNEIEQEQQQPGSPAPLYINHIMDVVSLFCLILFVFYIS